MNHVLDLILHVAVTVSALLGLSAALGAFMAGLMLTETEFDHRVVAEVVPMRVLFDTLFLVSVGMRMAEAVRAGIASVDSLACPAMPTPVSLVQRLLSTRR